MTRQQKIEARFNREIKKLQRENQYLKDRLKQQEKIAKYWKNEYSAVSHQHPRHIEIEEEDNNASRPNKGKFQPDRNWYIKNLTAIRKDITELGQSVEGELSVYAWEEYYPKFSRIINGIEVLINLMNSERRI